MLQVEANIYLRGYLGKSIPKYVKIRSKLWKRYKEGEYDRKNNLPNRYLKINKL